MILALCSQVIALFLYFYTHYLCGKELGKTLKILEQTDSGACIKSLKVEVPRDEVNSELDGVYSEFMNQATIPGFRKGKAPKKIVQMKYGKYLNDEAVGKAVDKAFKDAISELDLTPVTDPNIKEIDKDDKEKPIVFEVEFEFHPKVQLGDYNSIQIQPPSQEVSEKDVVETLNRLRENNAMYETVEDRPARKGDHVTLSSTATVEGEPFPEATHEEVPIELGSGGYIAGFEDQIEGMKTGEEKSVSLTLPDDFPQENYRGKEAQFEIKIKHIQEKKIPELDDEFAKDMGPFESLDDLKNRIREDLEKNQEQRVYEGTRNQIREELLKLHPIDVPPSMVKARYNYINAMQDMEYRQRYNVTLEAMAQQDEGLLARNEEEAVKEVRTSLILDAIAKEEEIEIMDQDYLNYIENMARQSGAEPRMVLQRIESQGMETMYRRMALEEKVMDKLVDRLVPAESVKNQTEEKAIEQDAQQEQSEKLVTDNEGSTETEE